MWGNQLVRKNFIFSDISSFIQIGGDRINIIVVQHISSQLHMQNYFDVDDLSYRYIS